MPLDALADGAALAWDIGDAALAGDLAALQSAIEAGADVNSANGQGVHPLMMAARDASTECVLLLLDAGADLHRATRKGCTALHLARVQRKRWVDGHGSFIAKPTPTDDAAIARIIEQFDDVIDLIESRAIDKAVAEHAAAQGGSPASLTASPFAPTPDATPDASSALWLAEKAAAEKAAAEKAAAIPNLASATLLSHFSAGQLITAYADGRVSEWGNMVRGGPSLRVPHSAPHNGPTPEPPRVSMHACNSLPALLFYGNAQLSGNGFRLGEGGKGSVLMVIKQTNDRERNKVPWQLGGYYVHSPYSDDGRQDQSYVGWRPDNRGPSGVRYHQWHVLLWIEDGNTTELWNNGSLAQIYRGGKQPAWVEEAMLTLNPNHCGHGIEGEIAEFCMFADALNAADRQALLAHISTKYRIGA